MQVPEWFRRALPCWWSVINDGQSEFDEENKLPGRNSFTDDVDIWWLAKLSATMLRSRNGVHASFLRSLRTPCFNQDLGLSPPIGGW